MKKILIGLETEYAFTPYGANGKPLDRARYSAEIVRLASERYPALFGRDTCDLFLANGSRLYVDAGTNILNLEYSTPETTDPSELAAHVRAGDRILATLSRDLEAQIPEVHHAFVSKTNFDYSGHTSGSHENYLHIAPQAMLASQLLPHLVTRVIYSGGGGFDSGSRQARFMLSPRVCFLEQAIMTGSEQARAIFSTRQETLGNSRYGRLHLVCGEGVRFQLSEYLRVGTTALIVRLIDSGVAMGADIELDPLPAMNKIARDVRCTARIAKIKGHEASAIDVQRLYLDRIQAHVGGPKLPDWAGKVCAHWRSTLDALEADPMQLAGALDWPTKLGLYRTHVDRQGYDWHRLTRKSSPLPLKLSASLFELDVRFGDVSANGSPAGLMLAGEQIPGLVSAADVKQAVSTPPQGCRAKLRGKWIKKLSPDKQKKECNWGWIHDHQAAKSLKFDDPLSTTQVAWQGNLPGHRRRSPGLMVPGDFLAE